MRFFFVSEEVSFVALDVPRNEDLTFAALASTSADTVDVDIRACGCIKYGSALLNFDSFVVRLKNNFEFFLQIAPKALRCVEISVSLYTTSL